MYAPVEDEKSGIGSLKGTSSMNGVRMSSIRESRMSKSKSHAEQTKYSRATACVFLSTVGLSILITYIVTAAAIRNANVPTPAITPKSFSHIPVQDSHMHVMDWTQLSYDYAPGTIHYYNWTHENFLQATKPSLLVPNRTLFMGVMNVPANQRLLQSQVVQVIADSREVTDSGVPFNAIVTVTTCDGDLLDTVSLTNTLDELENSVPLSVGCRCVFPPNWDTGANAGLQLIADRGLTFDIWTQDLSRLKQLYNVAEAVPDLTIILGHMGLPGSASTNLPDYDEWAGYITALADLDNVYVKISVAMVNIDALRPYVQHTIKMFGYDHSMYGSNWYPVNDAPGFLSARAWAEAVAIYLTELEATDNEAHDLLHRTAEKVYGLPPL